MRKEEVEKNLSYILLNNEFFQTETLINTSLNKIYLSVYEIRDKNYDKAINLFNDVIHLLITIKNNR